MNSSHLFRSSLVALLLSGALLAAPARVGIVRVEKGSVSLNGKTISTPQLLEQGNTLVLAKGASVRLQLLGGAGEVTLVGPKTVTVDRATLAKEAKVVQRGGIASVPDIGNTTRGATATSRDLRTKIEDFRIVAPPRKSNDGWVFSVKDGGLFDGSGPALLADWSIYAMEMEDWSEETGPSFEREEVSRGSYAGGAEFVEVPRDTFKPGTRYLLTVSLSYKDSANELDYYEQPFRLLSEAESAYLSEIQQEMRGEAKRTGSVRPLIELATLLLEWDQLWDAQKAAQEAKAHPNWGKLEPEVRARAEKFDRQIDKIRGIRPSTPPR